MILIVINKTVGKATAHYRAVALPRQLGIKNYELRPLRREGDFPATPGGGTPERGRQDACGPRMAVLDGQDRSGENGAHHGDPIFRQAV